MPTGTQTFSKPSAVERAFGKALAWLVRVGIVRGHFYVLEVKGRKTGKIISLPVDPITIGGQLYLVCPRGDSQWVRNVRALGEVTLIRALRRRGYTAREIPVDARPPILKAYLDSFAAEVQRLFPVPKGSAAEAFREAAPRYPVFALDAKA